MVPAVIGAVKLIVGIHPAAEHHQFHFREHLAMVVLGILRMRGIGQDVDHRALGATQASGREKGAVVVAAVALEK